MDRKGILFIPSFSVERSQEIACILRSANFKTQNHNGWDGIKSK